jgi:tRNA A-37 threonylcarbamoyl transferase component Bud32
VTDTPAAIGRYRIDGLLGRGAMGVVYRAHDPEIDRAVAIKLIRADLLDGDARDQYLQRFRREAQAAGRCTHPNIVALHDISADVAGNPFLVMEYVEGTSLDRLIALGRRLSAEQAVSMTGQILDALAAAHALGIVHRDIKPANILLQDGLRVKVTDFGISRIIASDMTMDGAVIGTPSYMSPEQIQGDEAGPASDLFSVASLFHESMTGEKAFSGDSLAALAMKLIQQPTPPVPGLPAALQAVLDRAHAKRPEDRFPSAAAMAHALRTAAQGRATEGAIEGATVVMSPGATPAGIGALLLEPGREAAIEALLVRYVGPIAKHLLQRKRRDAGSPEDLVRGLAAQIGDQEQAAEFVRQANAILRGAGAAASPSSVSRGSVSRGSVSMPSASAVSAIPVEARARATSDLARHVGPIASVLVSRAAATASTVEQLRASLASHVPEGAERRAFVTGR